MVLAHRQIIFLSWAAITLGAILWRWGNRMLRTGVKTKATIINNRRVPATDMDSSDLYYSTIQFVTEKKEKVVIELDMGTSSPGPVGTTIDIIYDPENPNDIVTDPKFSLITFPRVLVGGGIVGIAVAMLDALEIISIIPDK